MQKHYPLDCHTKHYFWTGDQNHSMTQYNMAGYLSFETNCIDRNVWKKALRRCCLWIHIFTIDLWRFLRTRCLHWNIIMILQRLIRQYPETNQEMKMNYKEMSDAELDVYIHHATPSFWFVSQGADDAGYTRTDTDPRRAGIWLFP